MACFGALKDFGLTDHQVDLNNKAMVEQYKRVYMQQIITWLEMKWHVVLKHRLKLNLNKC